MKCLLHILLLVAFISSIADSNATENFGTINGTITTSDGYPAAFVDVSLKGTSYTALTDEKGFFLLQHVKAETYTLVISLVGSQTIEKEITITADQTLTVNEKLQLTMKELEEVIVTTIGRYAPKLSSTATRMIVPLKDIPQSIQILPSPIIQERQIQNMGEATKSMVGINTFSSNQYADYVMRGFRTTSGNFAYNGIRGVQYQYIPTDAVSHFDLYTPMYNIERIEAIKGPASVLFSTGNPGGVINFVTKKPLITPRYELNATIGSYHQYRFMGDATGPVNKQKNVLYRMVAGYEQSGALDPNQKIKNIFLAPQLQWNISDRSRIRYELNYYKDHRTMGFDKGIPAYQVDAFNWQLDRYPIRTSLIDPNGYSKAEKLSNELTFNHEINSQLKLTMLFRTLHTSRDQFDWSALDYDTYRPRDTVVFSYGFFNEKNYMYQSSSFITWQPATGKWNHNIAIGLDFNRSGGKNEEAILLLEPYSVFNLNFSKQNFSYTGLDLNNALSRGGVKERTQMYGAYLQDLISMGNKWKVMISGRIENYVNKVDYIDPADQSVQMRDTISSRKFLPRLGVVYQPKKRTVLYASYTQGFQPQIYSNLRVGGPFPAEGSRQYEAGVKQEFFNGKLLATVAAFYIRKFNVLTTDTSNMNAIRLKVTNQVRSQGVEISIQGAITPALDLIANYAYTDAQSKVLEGNGPYGVGRFPNVPYHNGNIWLHYTISDSKLKGLHFGMGGVYVSNRTTLISTFHLPAYTIFDGVIGYNRNGLGINFNAYNLTNRRYYTCSYGPTFLWPGNPLSYRLSFNYTFSR